MDHLPVALGHGVVQELLGWVAVIKVLSVLSPLQRTNILWC